MAQVTIYKVAALVFDLYAKSQMEVDVSFSEIWQHHAIGKTVSTALDELKICCIENKKVKWLTTTPDWELIIKIDQKRTEIVNNNNAKYGKVKKTDSPYKAALEAALKRIEELEKHS